MCGFLEGPQNNWLFTQHIRKDIDPDLDVDYTITIFVNITYRINNCPAMECGRSFKILNYKVNSPQSQSNYRNTGRYSLIGTPDTLFTETTETFEFTLSRSEHGFYLAFQDEGTCVTISRVIVYYQRCPANVDGLVIRPEIIFPRRGAENPISGRASCKANSTNTNSLELTANPDLTCSGNPVCACIPGHFYQEVTQGTGEDQIVTASCQRMFCCIFSS